MDAIVEVTAARVAVEIREIVSMAFSSISEVIIKVVTSTLRAVKVLGIGGTSLSAVSPDFINRKVTALA